MQSLEKSIQNFPDLLKQEPETNHLIVNSDNQKTISAPVDGYEIQAQNFIAIAQNISKTAQFEQIPLEANLIGAEAQSWNLSQYTRFIDKVELPLSDGAVQKHNQELVFHKLQNVYIAAGQSFNFSDVIGKLSKESGYLSSVIDGTEVYGSGVELVVNALQSLTFKHMKVESYKGKAFSIGDSGRELTQLSVTNTSQNDVVLSLSKEGSQLTIVLASK
ncbi:VanW family protein [Streptococcus sp. X16XC17]|uniref:VanW family protein n=1 Tax=Streptococcus sp. X16XC17 TaxID=2316646 RepID=UPI000B31E427|nr:VanW family protein [Streptococcus sp. X16XC17]